MTEQILRDATGLVLAPRCYIILMDKSFEYGPGAFSGPCGTVAPAPSAGLK